jgi:tetratricopeptide (TPR) repeat protein
MPVAAIEVVELAEKAKDPLEEVASVLEAGKTGPVMVLGLEEAVPSSRPSHPVLHTLNLQRPEWRKRIPRPVVFWIPEYVLSLLGVEAPDFLDWRSDTIFFPAAEPMLDFLTSDVWAGGLDGNLPAAHRRARMEELQSRLRAASVASTDRAVQAARSAWLTELGNHLRVFGEMDAAENAYRKSLEIERELQRPANVAVAYNNLGTLALMRRRPELAAEMFEKSIAIDEQIENREGLAIGYSNLAAASSAQSSFARAEELFKKALELRENPSPRDLAVAYSNLAHVQLRQNRIEAAESLLKKTLRLSEESGDRLNLAAHYRFLAEAYFKRGDFKGAAGYLRKALAIDQEILYRDGMARDFALIGALEQTRGNPGRARRSFERALDLYRALGDDSMISTLRKVIEGA